MAKEGRVPKDNTYINYIAFGKGKTPLIMIPGLSTRNVRGTGLVMSISYRIFSNNFRVYMIDKKDRLEKGCTLEDMADDYAYAMKQLGISKAAVFGTSQGSIISQIIAEKYPELVSSLVLAVPICRSNPVTTACVKKWLGYAEKRDHIALNTDTFTSMYSDAYLEKHKRLIPLAAKLVKPADWEKFIISTESLLDFDYYEQLDRIKCPVFVIGGRNDKVTTAAAAEEIAEKLKCPIYMYDELGHAAYDEAEDFNQRILDFFTNHSQYTT